MSRRSSSLSSVLVIFRCAAAICCFIFGLTGVTEAQAPSQAPTSQPQATTDPSEAKALNSIFAQWGIEANTEQWNTTGDPCSGAAIDSTAFGDDDHNPFIKCECSDNVTCHITQLKVYALDVDGVLPDELWTLSYLSNLIHQGKSQFVTEIATISAVQHNNLVTLYGFCAEGVKRLLVYEYLENNSLDQALFGKKNLNLDWSTRFDICLGVARGLTYLHEESRLRIVHRDVKASNILLDSNLIPKISDFGLAKLYDNKMTHISTGVAGTIGYLAPEYAMRGHLTEKTDVFAFGVVALEIVSGRPNSDPSLEEDKMYLLEWAWNLHENNHELELVDYRLSEFSEEEAKRIMKIGLLCTQTSPMLRPTMSGVVGMLTGAIEVTTAVSKPGYLTDLKFIDATASNISLGMSTQGTDSSFYNSSASTSIVGDARQTPSNATHPILHDTVNDGR
ncbi:PREDICTED: probable LRR receptor-like serine/threonine-protein kinase At1g56130-like [Fragaria vesca subsp. vesca]